MTETIDFSNDKDLWDKVICEDHEIIYEAGDGLIVFPGDACVFIGDVDTP